MASIQTIHWTSESEITFIENIEYLQEQWVDQTIADFILRVEEVISNIKQNPRLYQVYDKKEKVHACTVNKHITLYYRIADSRRIDLISFWNNHQHPKRKRF